MTCPYAGWRVGVSQHAHQRWVLRIDTAAITLRELRTLAEAAEAPDAEEAACLKRFGNPRADTFFRVDRDRDCVFVLAPVREGRLNLVTVFRRTMLLALARRRKKRRRG